MNTMNTMEARNKANKTIYEKSQRRHTKLAGAVVKKECQESKGGLLCRPNGTNQRCPSGIEMVGMEYRIRKDTRMTRCWNQVVIHKYTRLTSFFLGGTSNLQSNNPTIQPNI